MWAFFLSRRYFLEEEAVDENGRLTREKQKAVNKIGHGKSCCITYIFTLSYPAIFDINSASRTRSCIPQRDAREREIGSAGP